MRDSLGGLVNIVIITIFIVFAFGYIAFNINYTKAFRMKDKIIALYEKYRGNCVSGSQCAKEIKEYADSIGYTGFKNCPTGSEFGYGDFYCVEKITNKCDRCLSEEGEKVSYKITTNMDLRLPIISNLFDFKFFYIDGNTTTMTIK